MTHWFSSPHFLQGYGRFAYQATAVWNWPKGSPGILVILWAGEKCGLALSLKVRVCTPGACRGNGGVLSIDGKNPMASEGSKMELMIEYGYGRTVDLPFEQAVDRITETLKEEGFGVLSRIDVHEKLKEKLGVEFQKYVILGACNPPIAHQSLQLEPNLGLLLPCNVIVYEKDGQTVVAVIDAEKMLSIVGNSNLETAAVQVNEKLQRAVDRV